MPRRNTRQIKWWLDCDVIRLVKATAAAERLQPGRLISLVLPEAIARREAGLSAAELVMRVRPSGWLSRERVW